MRPNRRTIRTVARKFWEYMKKEKQLLETRTELRALYLNTFRPSLEVPEKYVSFSSIMWMFRCKPMRIVEWQAVDKRENIIYLPGPTLSMDQSYLLRRQARLEREDVQREQDDLSDLKKKLVSTNRKTLAEDKGLVSIEPTANDDGIVNMGVNVKLLQLTVQNRSVTKVSLRCICLGSAHNFTVDDRIHKIVSGGKTAELGALQSIDFTVKVGSSNPGIYCVPVAFMFRRGQEELFHIVKYVRAEIEDDVVQDLKPTSPYVKPKPVAMVSDPQIEIIAGEPPPVQNIKYVKPLLRYAIPGNLRHEMNRGILQAALDATFQGDIDETNHEERFSKLLHVEELQMEVDIQKYSMEKAKLEQKRGSSLLTLAVPGLAENRPSLVRGDRLFVRALHADGSTAEKKEYEGFVHQIGLNEVYLKFNSAFHNNFVKGSSYRVRFNFSRTSLKVMHRAIGMASSYLRLIPANGNPPLVSSVVGAIRCFDDKIERNGEQKQAVENIVAGTSRPYPYVVFGPPGTGKTVTIVEAIKQVLKNFPESIVLACAPSNSAADLVLERVAQHSVVPKSQMVRLNAFGRSQAAVNPNIMEFCKMADDGYFSFPLVEEIVSQYRLVVTTLISAGRLVSMGIKESHFTHIFIDEAGHGMEPECLVPIVGLLGTSRVNGGQLVLAGDPKQLGPVLRSPVAIKHGLGVSFLERLMSPQFPRYNRQPLTDTYEVKMVTKLLNNYRSHPTIIKVPNEMFYENELRACANELLRSSLCQWDGLEKKGFPIMFEAVCGKDEREERSPSFFNSQEISVVLRFVKDLKEARDVSVKTEEIGIISPYHKQVQKIRQSLKKKHNIQDIKVGSVEEFQGQERKVIIISTVRSSEEFLQLDATHKLGFLKNPKRFNVAITRAKALLIVIGNPDVLCRDEHWRRFIQYCIDNDSFSNGRGLGGGSSNVPFQMPELADETLEAQLNKLSLKETFENDPDMMRTDYEGQAWRPAER